MYSENKIPHYGEPTLNQNHNSSGINYSYTAKNGTINSTPNQNNYTQPFPVDVNASTTNSFNPTPSNMYCPSTSMKVNTNHFYQLQKNQNKINTQTNGHIEVDCGDTGVFLEENHAPKLLKFYQKVNNTLPLSHFTLPIIVADTGKTYYLENPSDFNDLKYFIEAETGIREQDQIFLKGIAPFQEIDSLSALKEFLTSSPRIEIVARYDTLEECHGFDVNSIDQSISSNSSEIEHSTNSSRNSNTSSILSQYCQHHIFIFNLSSQHGNDGSWSNDQNQNDNRNSHENKIKRYLETINQIPTVAHSPLFPKLRRKFEDPQYAYTLQEWSEWYETNDTRVKGFLKRAQIAEELIRNGYKEIYCQSYASRMMLSIIRQNYETANRHASEKFEGEDKYIFQLRSSLNENIEQYRKLKNIILHPSFIERICQEQSNQNSLSLCLERSMQRSQQGSLLFSSSKSSSNKFGEGRNRLLSETFTGDPSTISINLSDCIKIPESDIVLNGWEYNLKRLQEHRDTLRSDLLQINRRLDDLKGDTLPDDLYESMIKMQHIVYQMNDYLMKFRHARSEFMEIKAKLSHHTSDIDTSDIVALESDGRQVENIIGGISKLDVDVKGLDTSYPSLKELLDYVQQIQEDNSSGPNKTLNPQSLLGKWCVSKIKGDSWVSRFFRSRVYPLNEHLMKLNAETSYRERAWTQLINKADFICQNLKGVERCYEATMVEICRRNLYSKKFESKVSTFVQELASFREEEIKHRNAYLRDHKDSLNILAPLLDDVFPSRKETHPPHFHPVNDISEPSLPRIEPENLHVESSSTLLSDSLTKLNLNLNDKNTNTTANDNNNNGNSIIMLAEEEPDDSLNSSKLMNDITDLKLANTILMQEILRLGGKIPASVATTISKDKEDSLDNPSTGTYKIDANQLVRNDDKRMEGYQSTSEQSKVISKQEYDKIQERLKKGDEIAMEIITALTPHVKRLEKSEKSKSRKSSISSTGSISSLIQVQTSSISSLASTSSPGSFVPGSNKKTLTANQKTDLEESRQNDLSEELRSLIMKYSILVEEENQSYHSKFKKQRENIENLHAKLAKKLESSAELDIPRVVSASSLKISFCEFDTYDIALFLPTSHDDVPRIYLAFHKNCPHRYLSQESLSTIKGSSGRYPDFILGRIVYKERKEATREHNPYRLQIGTTYYTLTVESL